MMKRREMAVLAACVAAWVGVASAGEQVAGRKVLMIGNSFSDSVMRETPRLAASAGLPLDIVQCYIGGCSFERHWTNIERAHEPDYRPYGIKASYATEPGRTYPKTANLIEMLTNDVWDVVTIQQASRDSIDPKSYHPFADRLIAKIRELAPTAEIMIHETWSYAPYDGRLVEWWKMTPAEMHAKLKDAYGLLAQEYAFRTIPMGDAVQLFRARLPVDYGKLLTKAEIAALKEPATIDFHGDVCGRSEWKQGRKGRDADWERVRLVTDYPHLNQRGNYLQACVWLAKLFGVDPTTFAYKPDCLTDAEARLMRECARDAVNLPLETAKWQAEIDRVAAAGGGTVTVPAGWHRTGSLHLKSGVTLCLAKGCVLEGSPKISDYDDMHLKYAEVPEAWQALIEAEGQHDVAIVGEGTIFGGGRAYTYFTRLGRPRGCLFYKCRNVRIEGIRFQDPASWTCYFKESENIVFRNVTVDSHGNTNNDGVDIDAKNVLVENCRIDSGDDAIVLKSDNPDFICENVEVRDCEVRSNCNLIKLGTASHGGFRNVSIHDCVAGCGRRGQRNPFRKPGVKSWRQENWPGISAGPMPLGGLVVECVDGGLTENITLRNVDMSEVSVPVFIRAGMRRSRSFHGKKLDIPLGTGRTLRNVTIENVRAKATCFTSSSITGVPELRLRNITLRNVEIEVPGAGDEALAEIGKPVPEKVNDYPESCMFDSRMLPSHGFFVRHVDGLVLDNVSVRVAGKDPRPDMIFDDVTGLKRTGWREEKGIRYSDAATNCVLGVRWPEGKTGFPTVVHLHGGGLTGGCAAFYHGPYEAEGRDAVARVAVAYRLLSPGGAVKPADCLDDAAAAVAWTLKNIARYGGDPKKVFVSGISAGGYLTAMIGMDPKWLAKYGLSPLDLAGIVPLTGQVTKHFNVRTIGFGDTEPRYAPKVDEWAPLYWVKTPAIPPACFLSGGRRDGEIPCRVEENEFIVASLLASGHRDVEFHETEGSHGGGTYPSTYFLRDFLVKRGALDGIGRLAAGERVALRGAEPAVAAELQLIAALMRPTVDAAVVLSEKADGATRTIEVRPGESAADLARRMCYARVVAQVAIDAKELAVRERGCRTARFDSQNVRVSNLARRGKGIVFDYAPKSLPLPCSPAYDVFNREIFAVEGLAPGYHTLAFDGRAVGRFSSEEFARGVNVAALDTPNRRLSDAARPLACDLARLLAAKDPSADDLVARLNALAPVSARVVIE